MQDAGTGQVLVNQAAHSWPGPAFFALLTASSQYREPVFADLIHELAQPTAVAGDRMIIQPPLHDRA